MPLKCFVAMPISTPVPADYDGDEEHFQHVLEELIAPALEQAGYQAIPPAATGTSLIHAEIVRNLETADLVLCDLSTLNPNVMLELGIRIALNRSICLIRDDRTRRLPFDTVAINTHTYESSLRSWRLRAEVEKLAEHVQATRNANPDNSNPLWRYFGLANVAATAEKQAPADPLEARVLLLEQQAAARTGPAGTPAAGTPAPPEPEAYPDAPPRLRELLTKAAQIAGEVNARVTLAAHHDDEVVLDLGVYVLGPNRREDIINVGRAQGLRVRFTDDQTP